MAIEFNDSAELHSHRLKQQRLVYDASIGSNATPASKTHASDIPGVVYLRTEGKTAEADAIEDVSSQLAGSAAADATGIFQILLDVPSVDKIYSVTVTPDSGTVTSTSKVTTGKKLLIEVDSSLSLAAVDLVVTVSIDYLER